MRNSGKPDAAAGFTLLTDNLMKNVCYPFASAYFMLAFLLISFQAVADFTINSGPSYVCPRGSYEYSVDGMPFGTTHCKWTLSYDGNTIVSSGRFTDNTFTVAFTSNTVGAA